MRTMTTGEPTDRLDVRTYKRRAGRVTATQAAALERVGPRLGLPVDRRPLDLTTLFGRAAPVVLEIGFGMGEATAAMALAQPDRDVLAVDVHTPGHGNLLKLLGDAHLTNVRVVTGDARVLLAEMLGPATLAAVRVFFPDPWPKSRHAKRRLVTPPMIDLVADRLADGGVFHLATDIEQYAERVRAILDDHPGFRLLDEVPWRPTTKFERRGLAAGRPAHDVAAVRVPPSNWVEATAGGT